MGQSGLAARPCRQLTGFRTQQRRGIQRPRTQWPQRAIGGADGGSDRRRGCRGRNPLARAMGQNKARGRITRKGIRRCGTGTGHCGARFRAGHQTGGAGFDHRLPSLSHSVVPLVASHGVYRSALAVATLNIPLCGCRIRIEAVLRCKQTKKFHSHHCEPQPSLFLVTNGERRTQI